MAADHWMRFNIGDYLADTMHLTTLQHGIYILLIMHYFKRGNLPDDAKSLARIAKVLMPQWKRAADPVLSLFRAENGQLHHRRIDSERERSLLWKRKGEEKQDDNDAPQVRGPRARPEPGTQSQNETSPPSPRKKRGANGADVFSFRRGSVRNGFISAAGDMMEDRDGPGGVQAETGSPPSRSLEHDEGDPSCETEPAARAASQ